tara:strand:+ start:2835 stop:3218 length:384 start_codon:yes stop_codon:yes gene_type:complete
MKMPNRIIEKPWGYEEIIVHTPKYVMKKIFIKAGKRLSKQFHNEKDETVYVHEGVLYLDLSIDEGESNIVKVVEGEAWRIMPPTIHRFCAPAEQDVVLFEVSTPELEDVFRLQDDYGRARGKAKTKI